MSQADPHIAGDRLTAVLDLSREERIERFLPMLVDTLGGREIIAMLWDYHAEGMTYQMLEEKWEIPAATIHRRLNVARAKLRNVGLMPERWEQ